MRTIAAALILLLTACTIPQAETGAQAILALCEAAPEISSAASQDTRNRLQAIADKCSAARAVVAGVVDLTPAIVNLVSNQAVRDLAADVAVVKGAGL